jgi:predicted metal-dependent peptidase
MAGKLHASLERFLDGMWDAKVDWKTLLRRFIVQTAAADYTWSRPNRRWLGNGHYLPKLWSEQMGEIVIAVDTSGSIGNDILQAFGAEINAIVHDVRPEKIHII